jgi:regulator of nucleoside diphosphate kinase
MHTELASRTRPPITIIDTEAETLSQLALASLESSPMSAELLLQELVRADTFEKGSLPTDVATMGSYVVFVDEKMGDERKVQLVYPWDADTELDRISVMTLIGAALIGMPRGASIDWPNRAGIHRRLKILEVIQPAAES